jgi:hypothetical protein
MHNAKESSLGYDFYDSGQTRRARKKLGEKEARKIVESVYPEVLQKIEPALSNLRGSPAATRSTTHSRTPATI